VPLEALASGRPVIAFGRGGVRETLVPLDAAETPTAVFFERQTVDDLVAAVERFEASEGRFEPKALRRAAESFDRTAFKERASAYLADVRGC
jgi:glycosyltransferase involved in cell wall biosynthesis